MTYSVKQAEQTVPQNETKNPPDAKPADWRSPWKGAAIGGTLGGLITTALGYLYGHRGRWLAYDAIAGGGTGAAVGYGVDAHNNVKAEEKTKPLNALSPQSKEGQKARAAKEQEEFLARHKEYVNEWDKVMSEGGFDTNPKTAGVLGAFMKKKKKNALRANAAHIKDDKQALEEWNKNRNNQKSLGRLSVVPFSNTGAIWLGNKISGRNPNSI